MACADRAEEARQGQAGRTQAEAYQAAIRRTTTKAIPAMTAVLCNAQIEQKKRDKAKREVIKEERVKLPFP